MTHSLARFISNYFDVYDFAVYLSMVFDIVQQLGRFEIYFTKKLRDFKVDVSPSPWLTLEEVKMKPIAVADEMFPEGAGTYVDAEEGGGSVGLLMDLSAVNEKAVHDGFFNDFEDLFDDEDLL